MSIASSANAYQAKIGNQEIAQSQQLDKAEAKVLTPKISGHTAPKGMATHIAVEHGIKPPARAGNAATTGQNNAYSLPN